MKNFNDIVDKIQAGISFEEILNDIEYNMVECMDNSVYYDDDFEKFLDDYNIDCDFGVGYMVINDYNNNKIYEVPYYEIENRFDDTLGDELIIEFCKDKFYDITENYI